MATAPWTPLHFDVDQATDEQNAPVTTVTCHGRLVGETFPDLTDAVKPLIERGGRILIDCNDLVSLDSSGLGALVGLKVTAAKREHCTLQLVSSLIASKRTPALDQAD